MAQRQPDRAPRHEREPHGHHRDPSRDVVIAPWARRRGQEEEASRKEDDAEHEGDERRDPGASHGVTSS